MLINKHTFSVYKTVARGLEAQRIAISTTTENIANASTTRTADGSPYSLKRTVQEVPDPSYKRFENILNQMESEMGVSDSRHFQGTSLRRRLADTEMGPQTSIEGEDAYRWEYDPSHPHADQRGYVQYPDINVVEEMARLISANRIYEANLSAFQTAKDMNKKTLEI